MLAATLRVEPPRLAPQPLLKDRSSLPIGGYLLGYGYLQPQQLVDALRQQRTPPAGQRSMLLGDILIARQAVSPRVLATFVVVQLVERLVASPSFAPLRLGEQLVAQGRLPPTQLAQAIQLQTWLRSKGVRVPLGEILVQQNVVTVEEVERALAQASPPR